jgi:acyl-[acyl carrier protein]--UDP-N-acetylglucosamine O-acyltransferase
MDLFFRIVGESPEGQAAAAAAALGALPLPPGGPLPTSGTLLVLPAWPPLPGQALEGLLRVHRRQPHPLTVALGAGSDALGLEGGPVAAGAALAVELAEFGEAARAEPGQILALARARGLPVQYWRLPEPQAAPLEPPPVPTPRSDPPPAEMAGWVHAGTLRLPAGVHVLDPATTWVDPRATVHPGAVLLPFTVIEGVCLVGPGCRIGPGSHLRDSQLGRDVRVWYSVVEESRLGDGVEVGPFAHLRPGCDLAAGVRIGNFVELKNARVGAMARLPHHAYMGEVDIGPAANIGAGAVVVNYDGRRKRRARIGAGAMVGCNSNIVAPAAVGDNGYVAAGSTVTEDVPPGALSVARGRQTNVEGWVERRLGPGTASGIPLPGEGA